MNRPFDFDSGRCFNDYQIINRELPVIQMVHSKPFADRWLSDVNDRYAGYKQQRITQHLINKIVPYRYS